ncbi:MAG: Unknown protein [uncultured Thiotrichaceae bacterium]|uniref:Uncharacterized protein n=1 Tax=uncultured Thiotrichaceae bacterium TaxID=298394 RepID=A0A6S6UCV0_9GAMM|nr:MAG: Unknown protein [uncultured Thiotrichaceae bacterium]
MEMLHKAIKQHPDQEAPLQAIAEEFAKDTRLLCLDALHLTEVIRLIALTGKNFGVVVDR